MSTVVDETIDLIRDYEAQIALYKVRIELLEQKERDHLRTLGVYAASPEIMLKKLTLAGFPAIDVQTIFETLDEWHRSGGTDSLIDWLAR